MRKSLLTLCLMGYGFMGWASGHSAMDSVGIEKVNGKTFIIHRVDERETLFGISRRYAAPMNDIIQENPKLAEGLQPGQRIRIPYVAKADVPAGAKLHKVLPGETLFSIAKNYQASVQEIMDWNELKGNDLSVGQNIIIREKAKPEAPSQNKATAAASTPAPEAKGNQPKKEEREKKTAETKAETPRTEQQKVESWTGRSEAPAPTKSPENGEWKTHTVEQGQTLFSLAKEYDAKVDDIIRWNMLTSTNLAPGQQLKVGKRGEGEPKPQAPATSTPEKAKSEKSEVAEKWAAAMGSSSETSTSSTRPAVESRTATTNTPEGEDASERKNIKEIGQAEVIEGTGNHKKYLVLHRTAPVGTIMRIRNEENDITIFARVVGKIPETGDNNRLLIKVSKAAYDQLKAVNNRFPVEISY